MNRVLIAGAGAEVDLGFRSGLDFTQDTFYRQKLILYNALADFYEGRLGASRDGQIPVSYKPAFLTNSAGAAFRNLVKRISRDNPMFLSKTLGKSLDELCDESAYSSADYKKLFTELIVESDDADALYKHRIALKSIPSDAHFGILEQYYSELLEPNKHEVRFWKLVNFYWSAFFSIVLPITDGLYEGSDQYCQNRYAFVLEHLDDAIHEMFREDHILDKTFDGCYYSKLRDKFSQVLTTNYTPYAASVVGCDDARIAWLGGRLSQFEHLPELEFIDYSKDNSHMSKTDFFFPYLLCQSPVKPLISLAQVEEYSKAAQALKAAEEIVVLGYSFCNEDAHISSMVGEALRGGLTRRLVYFSYTPKDGATVNHDKTMTEISRKLRVPIALAQDKVKVVPVADCNSKEFGRLCNAWSSQ